MAMLPMVPEDADVTNYPPILGAKDVFFGYIKGNVT